LKFFLFPKWLVSSLSLSSIFTSYITSNNHHPFPFYFSLGMVRCSNYITCSLWPTPLFESRICTVCFPFLSMWINHKKKWFCLVDST
jgi:hypothetical protein